MRDRLHRSNSHRSFRIVLNTEVQSIPSELPPACHQGDRVELSDWEQTMCPTTQPKQKPPARGEPVLCLSKVSVCGFPTPAPCGSRYVRPFSFLRICSLIWGRRPKGGNRGKMGQLGWRSEVRGEHTEALADGSSKGGFSGEASTRPPRHLPDQVLWWQGVLSVPIFPSQFIPPHPLFSMQVPPNWPMSHGFPLPFLCSDFAHGQVWGPSPARDHVRPYHIIHGPCRIIILEMSQPQIHPLVNPVSGCFGRVRPKDFVGFTWPPAGWTLLI